MGVFDYFKPVATWSAEKVREFIGSHEDGSYTLLDVRQPVEYERGHLPGAVLIPVGELDERVSELDPDKPTIVYCAAGVRSRAGASVLQRAGFRDVHSMSGGINAWNGRVADGLPAAYVSWFAPAHSAEELMALAWVLEDGTETFYWKVAEKTADARAADLFHTLVKAEEGHKEMLAGLFRKVTGTSGEVDFPRILDGYPKEKVMEGGMKVAEAVAWADGKEVREIVELAIALETASYDRYQTLQRRVSHESSIEVFRSLAAQEKRHLELLTEMFEKNL